jgi:hypothetical protein
MAEERREPAMPLEASPEDVNPHSRAADNAQGDSLPHGSVASVYEIEFVAECLAGAYARMVEFNKEELGLTSDEAEKRVRTTTDWDVKRATEAPADHITWYAIQSVMDHDPALGLATWERVKLAARDELETGHRAAAVFDWDSSPWNRAQFLAIRESFREEWRPKGGVEDALIDVMAQCYAEWLSWMKEHFILSSSEGKMRELELKREGHWAPPRVSVNATIEQAAIMIERYNRLFLRTLRALRDLRRYAPTVIVQTAGQVNVRAVQTNVAQPHP